MIFHGAHALLSLVDENVSEVHGEHDVSVDGDPGVTPSLDGHGVADHAVHVMSLVVVAEKLSGGHDEQDESVVVLPRTSILPGGHVVDVQDVQGVFVEVMDENALEGHVRQTASVDDDPFL